MNDTRSQGDFPPLTLDQIQDLATAFREVFGSSLSRAQFTDRLLMFLEDVPGYESGEVVEALVESAWAKYGNQRGRP